MTLKTSLHMQNSQANITHVVGPDGGPNGEGLIITSSGKWFNVLEPNPDDIDLKDIAHALSNQCRFTGHTEQFYSVAQHSVLVSQYCDPEDAAWGLLHDAGEAYLSDIARPIKKHPDFGPFYLKAEARLTAAVMEAFGLSPEMPDSVKAADDMLLRMEARDLMPDTFPVYEGHTESQVIVPWNPRQAYGEFVVRSMEVM